MGCCVSTSSRKKRRSRRHQQQQVAGQQDSGGEGSFSDLKASQESDEGSGGGGGAARKQSGRRQQRINDGEWSDTSSIVSTRSCSESGEDLKVWFEREKRKVDAARNAALGQRQTQKQALNHHNANWNGIGPVRENSSSGEAQRASFSAEENSNPLSRSPGGSVMFDTMDDTTPADNSGHYPSMTDAFDSRQPSVYSENELRHHASGNNFCDDGALHQPRSPSQRSTSMSTSRRSPSVANSGGSWSAQGNGSHRRSDGSNSSTDVSIGVEGGPIAAGGPVPHSGSPPTQCIVVGTVNNDKNGTPDGLPPRPLPQKEVVRSHSVTSDRTAVPDFDTDTVCPDTRSTSSAEDLYSMDSRSEAQIVAASKRIASGSVTSLTQIPSAAATATPGSDQLSLNGSGTSESSGETQHVRLLQSGAVL